MAAAGPAAQQHAAGRPANIELELQAIEDYRRFAALTIQRYYRGWIVRAHRARQEAAHLELQESEAARQAEAARLYKAARLIQDSWRSYKNKCIYKFFRDLIKFREAADPRQLLRHINAPEAALVDPAAGLHVRLRLGGSSFPPVLLYKVFTHRPVTDICAFGPRNYAAESVLSKPSCSPPSGAAKSCPSAVPTRTRDTPTSTGTSTSTTSSSSSSSSSHANRTGWYCRDDRNGWRPVIELQQHADHGQACYPGSGCSSSGRGQTSRHRAMPLRQRRSRLQLAHAKASSSGSKWTAAGCAGLKDVTEDIQDEVEESGHSSDTGVQPDGDTFLRCRQQQHFHHSPLVRRAERAQRLKQCRRQWLLKMYRTGMQASTSNGSSMPATAQPTAAASGSGTDASSCQQPQQPQQQTACTAQQAAPCQACNNEEVLLWQLEQQLLLAQTADLGPCSSGCSSGLQDRSTAQLGGEVGTGRRGSQEDLWDPDELLLLGLDAGILAWAQKLDFDSYQQQWTSTAVTLGSEVPQSERALLQQVR